MLWGLNLGSRARDGAVLSGLAGLIVAGLEGWHRFEQVEEALLLLLLATPEV